ncbi:C40 family peptidase [Desertibacillus haloalkaliphilus]|uniref:C40 family peptidase n=1 Tax=Desertibacillus haloalkaliphilus TaxID=1328930 RepID=UPI001C26D537|nr:C40 family peptidase [Desertibacillus haloalkaliphilus]MBU8905933.1 S-layer homology domain-containing protein [Desertibacillus haloalkaliphilus]
MSRKFIPLLVFTLIFSSFLHVSSTYASADEIIANAKKQIGVPYQFGGSSPSGFDCSGFIYYVFDQSGIQLPRTASDQYNAGTSVSKSELKKGDLVFFETYKPGPSHSGIYVGDNKFIHASSSRGITISSVNDPYYWAPRYLGAKRVLDDADEEVEVVEPEPEVLAALPVGEYHDVPAHHWAHDEIKQLSKDGIFSGYDQSLFEPNDLVTRAQAAEILAKAQGLDRDVDISNYSDVPNNHWAAGSIQAAADANYFADVFTSEAFEPEKPVTREEVALLFAQAFDVTADRIHVTYSDVPADHRAYEEVNALGSFRVITGYGDGSFRPDEDVTRAQFAKMVSNALQLD